MTDSIVEFPTSKLPPSNLERRATRCGEPADGSRRLEGDVRRVEELSRAEHGQMYALLSQYFANTTRRGFERDLAEKEWVILLADSASGHIRGFSTMMRLRAVVDGQPVTALFSGDTVIQREYWGDTVLPRLWSRHAFSVAESIRDARVYWFLICSGYKTYRFLPVFFRGFYPTYERPMAPAVKRLVDAFGRMKFPNEYDAERGVVRFANAAPLLAGVADITEQRLKDPHVSFFARANPGHARGDELACLVELVPESLSPAGRRMLGWRELL